MNPLSNIKALILDMDGVLWRDTSPIGDLPTIFAQIHELGLRVAIATNNSTKTVDEFLEKFREYGVVIEPWQIVTSSLATSQKLKKDFPEGGKIFVIGENGICKALSDQGFELLIDPVDGTPVDAVVVGLDRTVSYSQLQRATLHIRSKARFYGTNPDKTYPTSLGLVPGAGAILAAIEAATDISPFIIGKPSPYMFQIALERLFTKPEETLVVGDRLETDIKAGQVARCKTALVLSGVTTQQQVETWDEKPSVVVGNLNKLIKQL